MARPQRKTSPLSNDARVVLDALCKQPARIFDFTEVAVLAKVKRPVAEAAIRELRHQRYGAHLADVGPDGLRLRSRFAYLPVDAAARAGYGKLEHPDKVQAEHPAVSAQRVQAAERAAQQVEADAKARDVGIVRSQARRKDKLDRKLALAKHRQENGAEQDEVLELVPKVEDVIAAGYAPDVAAGIVAEQQALADGKSPAEAEVIRSEAEREAAAKLPQIEDDEPPYASEEEIAAAFAESGGAPRPSLVPNYEPPEPSVVAALEALADSGHDIGPMGALDPFGASLAQITEDETTPRPNKPGRKHKKDS